MNEIINYIQLKLAALGHPEVQGKQGSSSDKDETKFLELSRTLLQSMQEKTRQLADKHNPVDQNIQDYLERYFADTGETLHLQSQTLTLDRENGIFWILFLMLF